MAPPGMRVLWGRACSSTIRRMPAPLFRIARNPDPASRLAFLLALPVAGEGTVVLACAVDWPGEKDAFCYAVPDWPEGAEVVVVLSHNGFDVDRKMAGRVKGIDVILTGHTHDAVPEPIVIGDTIMIASGSNGKFVSRIDLDVRDGRMMGFRHKLIPIFSDVASQWMSTTAACTAAPRATTSSGLMLRFGSLPVMLLTRSCTAGMRLRSTTSRSSRWARA